MLIEACMYVKIRCTKEGYMERMYVGGEEDELYIWVGGGGSSSMPLSLPLFSPMCRILSLYSKEIAK